MGTRREQKRHHILIIVQNLPVPFDRRVWQEATTLKAAGFEVTVICPKKKMYRKGYEVIDGIRVMRYPLLLEADRNPVAYMVEFASCWLATAALSLIAYVRSPFGVIHACNPPDTYFLLGLLYRPFKVKFVFDHHDLSPEMYLAKGGREDGTLFRALVRLESWTMRSADRVIAVNESHREIAMRRGRVPDGHVVIVRSGPRSTWVKRRAPDEALKRGKRFLVVYLGEMCEQDGVDRLLEAIRSFGARYAKDTHFVLIGGGPDQPRMLRLADELGLKDMVEFTGRIPDEDLQSYLSTADVCVDPDPLTSWSNLSTMNKIIEYMAFGRAIVAFDLLENRRTATSAATYVEPNDVTKFAIAVRELLDDPARRHVMGQFGESRFFELLSWDHSAEKLIALYRTLLT